MKTFQLELNEQAFCPHQPGLCAHLVFFVCVVRSLIKRLWDVSARSVRGGTVPHQWAFIVKKNVETLHPINATTCVIPVSNLLPLCGNNCRVYKRVRFPNMRGKTRAVLPSAIGRWSRTAFYCRTPFSPGRCRSRQLWLGSIGRFRWALWCSLAGISVINVSE